MTRPVTSGGKRNFSLPMTAPSRKCPIPAITTAPMTTGMPCVAAMVARTETKAKLVPCMIGRRAPIGPTPTVWNSVATPANSIAIWTRYTVSTEPKANPAAPAMMMEGVTFDANIASTCCNPNGTACASGGVTFGSREMIESAILAPSLSFLFISPARTCSARLTATISRNSKRERWYFQRLTAPR